MSKLHSQLALFGAIDQEVVDAKSRLRERAEDSDPLADAAVIDMVEGFLPGTTGFAQHGWYEQLVTKIETKSTLIASSEGTTFPDLDQALDELGTNIAEEDDERDPVLARAVYGAVVLSKVYERLGRTEDPDPLRVLSRALQGWTQELEDGVESELRSKIVEEDGVEGDLRSRIAEISDRQDWVTAARSVVSNEFAESSRPCFGSLRKVDGQYCAYITTDRTDDTLTVEDIAKIVEPINWSVCCKFFCKMTKQSDEFTSAGSSVGEGWSRLVERISGECPEYYLDTALVFWKQQLADGSIFINYDLDPKVKPTFVEVDSGYIWVSPLQPKGVRIRTSKLERVSGLSPTATAALACLMGWGDTGHEMLSGTARRYMKDPTQYPGMQPFKRSPRDESDFKG